MRLRVWIGFGAALAVAAPVACSYGKAPNSAADAGTTAQQAFTFSPQGCSYAITPPDSRAFADFALDDATPVGDAAAPERVRVGLGGGTTKGAPGYADPTTTAVFTWQTSEKNHAARVRMGTDA